MDFTKENFIKLWKQILPLGCSVDLEVLGNGWGFGYFEAAPYSKEERIRYNISQITNTNEGIVMSCTTRLKEFHVGYATVEEFRFLRFAENVQLHGDFNDNIMDICNKFKNL